MVRRGVGDHWSSKKNPSEFDYGMGFDEWRTGDVRVLCEGVALVIAPPSRELLDGVVLDYVEIAPGELRFVFAAPGEDAQPLRRPAP